MDHLPSVLSDFCALHIQKTEEKKKIVHPFNHSSFACNFPKHGPHRGVAVGVAESRPFGDRIDWVC